MVFRVFRLVLVGVVSFLLIGTMGMLVSIFLAWLLLEYNRKQPNQNTSQTDDKDQLAPPLFIKRGRSRRYSVDDDGTDFGTRVNPATGLPMQDALFDVGGNCFGCDD